MRRKSKGRVERIWDFVPPDFYSFFYSRNRRICMYVYAFSGHGEYCLLGYLSRIKSGIQEPLDNKSGP